MKLPNIVYKQKEDFKGGEKFRSEFLNYIESVSNQKIEPIEELAMRLPFKIVGNKFLGVHGVTKYGSK